MQVASDPSGPHLRGTGTEWGTVHHDPRLLDDAHYHRHLQYGGDIDDEETIFQSASYQIAMSAALAVIIVLQLALLASFIRHRSKRVLEFAQPAAICLFVACGIVATSGCYLYLYAGDAACALREPLIFVSISCMGAIVAGKGWRISTLLRNPLVAAGGHSKGGGASRVEGLRLFIIRALGMLSGWEPSRTLRRLSGSTVGSASSGGRGRQNNLRVQVSFWQMAKASAILALPQLLFQIVVVATPALRSSYEASSKSFHGDSFVRSECQSSAPGSWPMYVSVLLGALPFGCAYLLNMRPKGEKESLPDIIDEKDELETAFGMFLLVAILSGPTVGLSVSPDLQSYATITLVLALPLSLCYEIAFTKLKSTRTKSGALHFGTSVGPQKLGPGNGGRDDDGKSSAGYAAKMAEMYQKIGRARDSVQLVDETLAVWRKGGSSGIGTALADKTTFGSGDKEEVGSGFTKSDLKSIEPEELEMIINLLTIKGKALIKLQGMPAGMTADAQLNVDALKIFQSCPSASRMKDVSIMFPIYSLVAMRLILGVIEQDDEFSLEMELAERYCLEAQAQSYHYARALANIAEMHSRKGQYKKALRYFEIMKYVYLPKEHPQLLIATYTADHCAISFATVCTSYLLDGQLEKALCSCDYVIETILPGFDKSQVADTFAILFKLVRVLKWNGHESKALQVLCKFAPDATANHPVTGAVYTPLLKLLQICSNKTSESADTVADIDFALSCPDKISSFQENGYTVFGWSPRSVCAELCLHYASKLTPGNGQRQRLVNKGVELSFFVDDATTSDGMIKHILAHEVNRGVHQQLLDLAKENALCERNSIHSRACHDSTTTNGSSSFTPLTQRLKVKESPALKSSFSAVTKSKPSEVDVGDQRKVSFLAESFDSKHSLESKHS